MKTISAQELKKKIDDKEDFVLVDVLSKESFEGKHVPSSKNILVSEIEDRAEKNCLIKINLLLYIVLILHAQLLLVLQQS